MWTGEGFRFSCYMCHWWLIQEKMSADVNPLHGMDHGSEETVLSGEGLAHGKIVVMAERSSVLDCIILGST